MPVKKKNARKKAAPKKKKIYYCVPCGMEVTVSKAGIGTSTLMCCGTKMKPKGE
jgi:desulfoferrodoxin-like iron-binding protein